MKVVNYEKGTYKTLSYSDFCTTEEFEYETAFIREGCGINPYLFRPNKGEFHISSMSKHLEWKTLTWNILKNDISIQKILCETKPGCFRRKIYDKQFYLKKQRDSYIKDITNIFYVFEGNGVNSELIWYINGNADKAAVDYLRYYLNGWPDEKINLYFQCVKQVWKQKLYGNRNVYLQQLGKGELPYVFFDRKPVVEHKIEKRMPTVQDLRTLIQTGKILMFIYNGLTVEIKGPITTTLDRYDFSRSVFINGQPISSYDIHSEEHKLWVEEGGNNSFRSKLYQLLDTRPDVVLEDDPDHTLINHWINTRSTEQGERSLYIVTYVDSEGRERKHTLAEFNEERAEIAVSFINSLFPNQIKGVIKYDHNKRKSSA